MKLHIKLPPPSHLPHGLIALVRTSRPPRASTSQDADLRGMVEPVEATRAWKPDRSLLQPDPPPTGASDFMDAANEQTMVGATNLNDPCLFRSEPPPALIQDANVECVDDEEASIEFVGSLIGLNRDEEPATMASVWGSDEKTRLYRPQRSRLPPEEPCDEFEPEVAPEESALLGPAPPKVIIAPAVWADSAPDPARAEATKKKRRARRGADTKLGLSMCLLGGLALALSVAWRHPRTAPATHDAFARVAAIAASLLGR
jgi:hypothetical protein